jgi:hypothetical protein
VFLQAFLPIPVGQFARIGDLISRSIGSDTHINIIYLIYHNSLLLLSFISFRITTVQLNSVHSKLFIDLTDTTPHKFQQIGIQAVNQQMVIREASEQAKCPPQAPAGPRARSSLPSPAVGKVL